MPILHSYFFASRQMAASRFARSPPRLQRGLRAIFAILPPRLVPQPFKIADRRVRLIDLATLIFSCHPNGSLGNKIYQNHRFNPAVADTPRHRNAAFGHVSNVMFIECVWGDMDLFQNLPQMGVRDPPWEEFEAEFADEKRNHSLTSLLSTAQDPGSSRGYLLAVSSIRLARASRRRRREQRRQERGWYNFRSHFSSSKNEQR
jgi:hypothetical protein